MKICIYYFSGAGNTECVAKIISKIAKRQGHHVYKKRISANSLGAIEQDYDVLGVGFPIHFRQAPAKVSEFLAKQPGQGKKLFTFCTKGLYSGNAAKDIQLLAKEKQFSLAGNLELYMPGSDVLALMAKKESLTERILKSIHSRKIKAKIESFLSSVYESSATEVQKGKWYIPFDNAIVRPLEKYFTKNYQIFINRFSTNQELCDHCLICVRNCPNRNILHDSGKIIFGSNCSFCLRCIHRCPQEAIEIKNKTENNVKYRPKVIRNLSIRF